MKKEEIYNLQEKAKWLRIELFKMLIKSKSGHIPSCFSMVEILVSLYYGGISNLNHVKYNDEKRDRVLISKGHAAMALYPILADLGNFEKNELEKFTEVGGILGLYADFRIPGIEFIYPDYVLEIYNRYGTVLFKGNKNKPQWDGRSSQEANSIDGIAANGIYFYILYYNKNNKGPKQGRLYLNR